MPDCPSSSRPRVLVTGAGGFIGSALLAPLAQDFAVRAGIRRALPKPRAGVELVACDLDDRTQLKAALDGVDLVIHAAYGDEAAMPRQAENLLAAMAKAGIASLIAFSSVAVYGAREGRIVEADPPQGPLAPYALAKAAAKLSIVPGARTRARAASSPCDPGSSMAPAARSGSRKWLRAFHRAAGAFSRARKAAPP